MHRVRSLRRYEFIRRQDGKLLVRGATEWVFVDLKTGYPMPIPENIAALFPLLPDEHP
jgi:acyl-CoA thioesterase FadM